MNGGKISGFFGSMFGELFLDKDCANILQDPHADPMDKDICETFKEFSAGFPSIEAIVDKETDEASPDQEKPDAQSLRDSIFDRQTPRQQPRGSSGRRPKGDEDLDSQLARGVDPNTLLDAPSQPSTDHEGFSSYTKVTVTRRPDGTVEERHIRRDSLGNEEETTIIRDGESSSERPSVRSRLSDWVWPKH